jgi:hypothetical protein
VKKRSKVPDHEIQKASAARTKYFEQIELKKKNK